MKTSKTFPRHRSRGAAIAEVAIVLPVLIILTFGAIKYGWLFYRLQQVTNVTRQAARYAIRPSVNDGMVTAKIQDLMRDAGLEGKYVVTELNSGAAVGNPVTVSINVPADKVDILKLNGSLIGIPAPKNLSASVTMSKEGPQ
jgi:Flp pilus assembly protein TadG